MFLGSIQGVALKLPAQSLILLDFIKVYSSAPSTLALQTKRVLVFTVTLLPALDGSTVLPQVRRGCWLFLEHQHKVLRKIASSLSLPTHTSLQKLIYSLPISIFIPSFCHIPKLTSYTPSSTGSSICPFSVYECSFPRTAPQNEAEKKRGSESPKRALRSARRGKVNRRHQEKEK